MTEDQLEQETLSWGECRQLGCLLPALVLNELFSRVDGYRKPLSYTHQSRHV